MTEERRAAGIAAEMTWESAAEAGPAAAAAPVRPDSAGWGGELCRAMAGEELLTQWCGAQPCKTLPIHVSAFNTPVFSGVSSPSDVEEKYCRWYQGELIFKIV